MKGRREGGAGKAALAIVVAVAALAPLGCNATTPAVASGSASGTEGAAVIPDEIVGTWTTEITAEDLRAAGRTSEGDVAENAGTFTMTLGADGTWSTSQESEVAVKWPVFKGTLVATGPNSFRQATTFPPDFAGDVVDFTWSIEGGALLVDVVAPPDPILPVIMESHPWQPKE